MLIYFFIEVAKINFFATTPNRLYELLEKILTEMKENKSCSYKDIKTINDIRQAVKTVQASPLLFKKYYKTLSSLIQLTESHLNEASV
jgi:hypothetical protein